MDGHETSSDLDLGHALLAGSPEAILLISHKLRVRQANAAGLKFLHKSGSSEFGFPLEDCLPELATTVRGWLNYFQDSASSQPLSFNYLLRHGNESDSYRIRIIPVAAGDLTEPEERRYYLAALKQDFLASNAAASAASLERITSALPAIVYVFNLQEGRNKFLNHRFEEIMGWSRAQGEITNQYFEENLHPEDARQFPEWVKRWDQAKDGEVYSLQYRLKDTSGQYHWFQTYDTVLSRSADGRVMEIAGSAFVVDQLKEIQDQLEHEKSRLQAIATQAPVSIMETDARGSILYLNRLQFGTGYQMKDIIGYSLFDFVSPEYHLKLEEALERALQGEEISLETRGPARDGTQRWMLLRFARIDYTASEPDRDHLLVLGEEITRRKEMMERMEALSLRADSANRSKTEFFVGLSHDIRTPMNSILGIADLLLQSNLDDEQKEMAGILRDSSEALLGLLERTLQLSRVELGLLDSARLRSCNLPDLVRKCTSLFQTEAQSRGLALNHSLDPELPEVLLCFESGLMQIIVNLLGNAVKYTSSGSVELRIRPASKEEISGVASARDGHTQYLTVEVKDTGPGISSEDLPHIFKLFYQGEEARKLGEGGIGLSGCRRIAENAGGTIDIISPYPAEGNCGTLAVLVFPYHTQSETNLPPTSRERSFHGIRIMLVEDNDVNQLVAKRMLGHLGASTECAGDVSSAIQLLKESKFDLVLLDLGLPDGDGRSVSRWMRSHGMDTPVVALTAAAFEEEKESALAAGMDGFLTKPITQDILRHALAEFLPAEGSSPDTR